MTASTLNHIFVARTHACGFEKASTGSCTELDKVATTS